MQKTFFEAISTASTEKIHSEMIAWIFNLPKEVLSNDEKSKVLNQLAGISSNEIYENISAETEVLNIDIVIRTSTKDFLIENKLKSSEHSQQTIKYQEEYTKAFGDGSTEGIYLTLIGEFAANTSWQNCTYENLLSALEQVKISPDHKEKVFFDDYLLSVNRLVELFNSFNINPEEFPSVFSLKQKKGKKKSEKGPGSKDEMVMKLGLETIFNKLYLIKLSKELKYKEFKISESRGKGRLFIKLKKIEVPNIVQGKFLIAFTIQGSTLKLSILNQIYGEKSKYPSKEFPLNEGISKAFFKFFNDWNRSVSLDYQLKDKTTQNKSKKNPRVSSTFQVKTDIIKNPKLFKEILVDLLEVVEKKVNQFVLESPEVTSLKENPN